ncbi:MAG: DUF305 domain-containing protein [Betaproteobacteria bacterium]
MRHQSLFARTHRGCWVIATFALFVGTSMAIAQTPANPSDKAAGRSPTPMSAQPMPMEKKDSSMAAMPGMGNGGDMRGSMMGMMKNMETMKTTGDTDRDFAAMMKIHHQGAIDMAQMELKNGKDATMRAMAKRIIDAQQKEIREFDQWLGKKK